MDAELKELLLGIGNTLVSMNERFEKRFDDVDKRFDKVDERVGALERTVAEMNGRMQEMAIAQAVMAGRLDEQRSVLAALIPTRIAAVPPAA